MSDPIRSDTDPIEWARQLLRIAEGGAPSRPVLISHFDCWEFELDDD
jgi:hypothetical protein